MIATTPAEPTVIFREGLKNAAGKLHAANVRLALFMYIDWAVVIGSWFIVGSGLVAVFGAFGILPASLGKLCLVATLFSVSAYVLVKTITFAKVRPSLAEVSERLDLAIHSHNQIATAYELSKTNCRSEFSSRALFDGVRLLEISKEFEPVLPVRFFQLRAFSKLLLLVGVLAFVGAEIWPSAIKVIATSSARSEQSAGNLVLQRSVQSYKPQTAVHPDPSERRVPTNLDQEKKSQPPAGRPALQKNERSESSSTALASAGQQSPSFAGAAESKPPSDRPSATNSAQTTSNLKQSDQPSSALSKESAMSSSASPDANAGQPVAGTPGGNGAGDAAKSPPGNSGSGSGANADSKSGSGQGGKGGVGQSRGNGAGTGEASGEPTSNGKGKGAGQNSLKKSRGVAPEYLGGLDPDLLTGPKLSGPDEQTREQISALRGAGTPAPDAAAALRLGPESPILHYDAPADSRSVVSDYFKALHDKAP